MSAQGASRADNRYPNTENAPTTVGVADSGHAHVVRNRDPCVFSSDKSPSKYHAHTLENGMPRTCRAYDDKSVRLVKKHFF